MNKIKIGILTFHRAHNYGALLQCYALLTYLRSLGHDVQVIDYWPEYHANSYKLLHDFSRLSFKGKIKYLFLFFLGFSRILKRAYGYKCFIEKHIGVSRSVKYVTPESLELAEFDVVIYGSDQIWWYSNLPDFKGYDFVYWGQQPKNAKRKISYAASMGVVSTNSLEIEKLKELLCRFNALSVREMQVKELLESSFGIETSLVLDPVFLLGRRQWNKLINNKVYEGSKYIFFYHLLENDDAINLVNSIRDYYGIRVVEIKGRVDSLKFDKRYHQTVDPIRFVHLIRDAEFIVTTSFHGVAFSIVFEKQFYVLGMGNNSERAKSLLNCLSLRERYIDDIKDLNLNDIINYEVVNSKLDKFKSDSLQYLLRNI